MADKKIFFLTENCRLYPAEPTEMQLHRRWHVFYYIDKKRLQRYGNINAYNTVPARIDAAKKLAKTIEEELFLERVKAAGNTQFISNLQSVLADRTKMLRPKSAITYQSKVNAFTHFLTQKLIVTPTKNDAAAFFDGIRHKQAATYNDYLETLSSLTNQMVKNGFLHENIFSGLQKLKADSQPKLFFTDKQLARLKSALNTHDNSLLWLACQMQYYTFLRSNELRQLKVGDLILEENKIIVRGEISKNKKTEFVVMPKHLTLLVENHIGNKHDSEFVFAKPTGKQLSRDCLYRQFKKILIALNMNIKKHSFYSWKHTGARAWVKSGGSVYGLMRQMRHHSLDMTQLYLRKLGILEFEDDVNAMPII